MLCNELHQLTNGITTSKSSSVCMSQDVFDQIQGEDDISLSDDESIEINDVDGGEASGFDSKLSDTQEEDVITADTNQSTPASSNNRPNYLARSEPISSRSASSLRSREVEDIHTQLKYILEEVKTVHKRLDSYEEKMGSMEKKLCNDEYDGIGECSTSKAERKVPSQIRVRIKP